MSDLNTEFRHFLAREVTSKRLEIAGTILKAPELKNFGAGSSPVWVADVGSGKNRPLVNVPIKAGPKGSRAYAELGQAVTLRRLTGEKFQIVGPGDRVVGYTVRKTYDVGVLLATSTKNVGQVTIRRPYEFYKGGLPGSPGTGLYGIATGYPRIDVVDGDGNVIG